jgi:hypothetical protein
MSITNKPVNPQMIFTRTSLGAGEAVSTRSALATDLRYLLILVDGQSTLEHLTSRFDGADIEVAAAALWSGGYVRLVREAGALPAEAQQPGGLWDKIADTLSRTQPIPVFRPDGEKLAAVSKTGEVKFSASGKFWFSQGGQQLSAQEAAIKAAEPAQVLPAAEVKPDAKPAS